MKAHTIKLQARNGNVQERTVTAAVFSRRLKIYLGAHGVDSIDQIKLSGPTPMILDLADGRYINPGAPITMCDGQTLLVLGALYQSPRWGYRRICKYLEKHVKSPNYAFRDYWDCPSLSQIRTFLDQIPVALREYLTRGYAKMYGKFGFARKIDWGDFNFWWAGDAFCLRNVWFYDPARPEGNQVFQPWVSFVLECASHYCVSHIPHQEDPNSNHGIFLLRDGIIRHPDGDFPRPAFGIPSNLRTDNRPPLGNEAVKTSCDQLHINYAPIDPHFSAQNALAERAVQTFKKRITDEVISRLGMRWRTFNKACPIGISDWPEFVRIVREAIHHAYHHSGHVALNGETPYNACLRLMGENLPDEVAENWVIIATSHQGTARMTKHGVRIMGEDYLDKEKFQGLEGRIVQWVLDPLNPKSAKIIYQGELVCEAPKNIPLGGPVLRGAFKRPARALARALVTSKRTLMDMLHAADIAPPPRQKGGRRIPKTDGDSGITVPESIGPLPNFLEENKP